ncbi:MAG: archease [Anaerolineae bacterium]|nr:archease [Anaerolineae bacterium]
MDANVTPPRPPGVPALAEFTVVEHTADWALQVRGRDFRHLLLSAAWGMNSLLVADLSMIGPVDERYLEVEAFDRESMLVEWLSELAYLAERDRFIACEFTLESVSPEWLQARLRGDIVPALQKHIKAVTYHNLDVILTPDGLAATIVFDV